MERIVISAPGGLPVSKQNGMMREWIDKDGIRMDPSMLDLAVLQDTADVLESGGDPRCMLRRKASKHGKREDIVRALKGKQNPAVLEVISPKELREAFLKVLYVCGWEGKELQTA